MFWTSTDVIWYGHLQKWQPNQIFYFLWNATCMAAVKKRSQIWKKKRSLQYVSTVKSVLVGEAQVLKIVFNPTNLRNHLWHLTISYLMSLLLKSVMMQRRKRTRKKKPMEKKRENKAKHANLPSRCLSNKTRTNAWNFEMLNTSKSLNG